MAQHQAVSVDGQINFTFTGDVPRVGETIVVRPKVAQVLRVEWTHVDGTPITAEMTAKVILDAPVIRGS